MSDDDLIEAAAKRVWPEHRVGPLEGAKQPLYDCCATSTWYKRGSHFRDWVCGSCMCWNPLLFPEHAFQLLELLHLEVKFGYDISGVDWWQVIGRYQNTEDLLCAKVATDPDLKRAIVLCAAGLP